MTIIITPENEKYTLKEVFPISIAETDCTHRIKPVVVFNYMQDVAEKSIDKIGHEYSCNELLKKGLGWFLIRYRIEFDFQPKDVKEIEVLTQSRGCQKLTAYRDFEVFDKFSGDRILRATSSWLIVDLDKKSVVNIQKEFSEFFELQPKEDDLLLRKLKLLDRVDFEKVFSVRYDDLDINKHVNNTVYITWALEALDYDFRANYSLKSLDVYFKHEAKYGEDIVSQVKINREYLITEHVIRNKISGEELCLLRAEFAKNW
jgi:medium-chain acyl-[acyl-carrier-protein] hydrolase